MAKTKISEFSSTPGSNTDIDGINIAEGCAPSGINDAIRELMAQLKDFQTGAQGDSFNGPIGTSTAAAGAFTTLTASSTATLNTLSSSGATITGGSINGTTIGASTASTGAFTTLAASGAVTLSGATANGVAYANGSKVLTTGSALTFDGTNFATTGSVTSAGASNSGNLTFTGTGNRITGDFSNATLANRLMLQTSTVNGASTIQAIPNGTGTTSGWSAFNNSDPTNAANMLIFASSTEGRVSTGITGTGTYLPMTFYTGGTERMRIDSGGNVGIGTSSPSYGLDIRKSTGGISWSTDPQWWVKRDSGAEFLVQPTSSLALVGTFSNHSVAITTNNTERMRIDSSGNVGIGTSSPSTKLTVAGSSSLGTSSASGNTSIYQSPGSLYLTLNTNGTLSGARRNWAISPELDVAGGLSFTVGTSEGATPSSTKMILDSSGYLLINQTSNSTSSYVQIKGSQPALSIESTSSGSVNQVLIRNPNGTVGSIGTSGSSTSFNTSSDYRLKENIQPMQNALATIAQLKPVTYNWKADGSEGQGFIAHELQAVVPDCVTGEKDAVDAEGKPVYQGVDTSFLVATLTAALQEAHGLIKDLQARVDALEAK